MTRHLVKTVFCTGSPYEIGLTHGKEVAKEVHANKETYTAFFDETAHITWDQAKQRAVAQFVPTLEAKWPEILEEMQGIAEGAGGSLTRDDILTLNVRSEIALTNYTDGCTCISQRTGLGEMFVAQNWDWIEELHRGMVFLHIKPAGSAITMKFLGEAGIVGKIGMNSAGFGLCSNAIRSGAFDATKLPVHVLSRRLLQFATSVDQAVAIVDEFGVASATNWMLADKHGKHLDLEGSPYGNTVILPCDGYVVHTNHLYGNTPARLTDHPSPNSMTRLARMKQLTEDDKGRQVSTSFESLRARFSDEEGTPYSICRDRPPGATGMERMVTLSTIMMELKSGTGQVTIGRPCDDLPIVEWSF